MTDRVVFDTNVSISALLWRGEAYRAVLLAKAKVIQAVYCNSILAELTTKLREEFGFDENHIEAVAYQLRQYASRVEIPGTLRVVAEDPDDDKFIECAVIADARWIVSGDRHLLAIGQHKGVHIISAHDLLAKFESEQEQETDQANGDAEADSG